MILGGSSNDTVNFLEEPVKISGDAYASAYLERFPGIKLDVTGGVLGLGKRLILRNLPESDC